MNLQVKRVHLWRDIAPYICLYEDCDSAEAGFTSVHAWLEHMKAKHWKPVFVCSQCQGLQVQCQSEAELQKHIQHLHKEDLAVQELSLVARFSRHDFCLDRCLICGLEQGIFSSGAQELPIDSPVRQNNINKCMASHLEALALSSLPYHLGSKHEANSNSAQVSENSVDVGHGNTGPKVDRQGSTDSMHIGNLHDLKHNPEAHLVKTLEDTVDTWNQTIKSTEELVEEPTERAGEIQLPPPAIDPNEDYRFPQQPKQEFESTRDNDHMEKLQEDLWLAEDDQRSFEPDHDRERRHREQDNEPRLEPNFSITDGDINAENDTTNAYFWTESSNNIQFVNRQINLPTGKPTATRLRSRILNPVSR